MRSRVIFAVAAFILATLAAAVSSYVYGWLFEHDRYWEGTIRRVQETEIALLGSMLELPGAGASLPRDRDRLGALFAPLDGKLVIEVREAGAILFDNRQPDRVVRDRSHLVHLDGGLQVSVQV